MVSGSLVRWMLMAGMLRFVQRGVVYQLHRDRSCALLR